MAKANRIKPIDCAAALHELVPSVNQLTYMTEHAVRLVEVLNVKLERTYALAPKRKQSYKLIRRERKNPQDRERLLEKAIWMQWNEAAVKRHGQSFVVGLCRHIQTYQTPLQGSRSDTSWGKIDLVGVTDAGLPVVLELKREDSNDTPLRMLVEGLAYAVAVRRAWNEGHLRDQWAETITTQSKSFTAPTPLSSVPVIGIAPVEYWKRRVGAPGKRTNGKVKESAWKPFHELCDACSLRGFPIHFLQFATDGDDPSGLPHITKVEQVQLPQT